MEVRVVHRGYLALRYCSGSTRKDSAGRIVISHSHKSIFVHIPKTAGTSIEFKLGHFQATRWGVQDHRSIREIEPLSFLDVCRMAPGAELVILLKRLRSGIKGRPRVSRYQYQTYFKFAFVRNPWARIYSWYQNVMRDSRHRKMYGVEAECTFRHFLQRHLDLDRGPMRPQLHWLIDRHGNIPLDFVGRFEHLERDFGHVCDVLQIQDADLPRLIVGDYRERYTDVYDEDMIGLIARCYAPEIELFSFRFGE
jgi:hypothetical protein